MVHLKIIMIGICGALCVLILAPAFLAAHSYSFPAVLGYLLFSPICHQIPERSFQLCGYPLAVCHRCSGVYLGLFIGFLLPLEKLLHFRSPMRRKTFILCMCAPMVMDILFSSLGIWHNTPLSRFATGLIFGSLSASMLALAFGEFPAKSNGKELFSRNAQAKGVIL